MNQRIDRRRLDSVFAQEQKAIFVSSATDVTSLVCSSRAGRPAKSARRVSILDPEISIHLFHSLDAYNPKYLQQQTPTLKRCRSWNSAVTKCIVAQRE